MKIEIQIECLIGLGNIWRMTHEYKLARSTHQLAVKVANISRIGWLRSRARILLAGLLPAQQLRRDVIGTG